MLTISILIAFPVSSFIMTDETFSEIPVDWTVPDFRKFISAMIDIKTENGSSLLPVSYKRNIEWTTLTLHQ